MRTAIQLGLTLLIINLATPLSVLDSTSKDKRNENALLLSKVVQYIVDTKLRSKNRRALNPASLNKARARAYLRAKGHLRNRGTGMEDDPKSLKDVQAALVETELKTALSHKKSALFDRPYVEKQGKNDFLVMRPDVVDPFVTVVPNHIYYDVEKRCVNWLDDCSLTGIRARLLRGVSSP